MAIVPVPELMTSPPTPTALVNVALPLYVTVPAVPCKTTLAALAEAEVVEPHRLVKTVDVPTAEAGDTARLVEVPIGLPDVAVVVWAKVTLPLPEVLKFLLAATVRLPAMLTFWVLSMLMAVCRAFRC